MVPLVKPAKSCARALFWPVVLVAALAPRLQAQQPIDSAAPERAHRVSVTTKHLATAFRDSASRVLLLRARVARLTQDSALRAYEATAYHRISAGMGFSKLGRNRLIFRAEHAAHVHWQKGVGAYVELKGMRAAIPIAPAGAEKGAQRGMSEDMMVPIPYYPGYESLFPTGGMAETEVDDRALIHPLAEGAEAYYVYDAGDSVTFRLPNGATVGLRELRVRPRRPDWKTVVGSFWFDVRSGQLVRAAYRLSTPIDIWTVIDEEPKDGANDGVPRLVKGLASPMKGELSAASVEYGLYEGRFWLPRLQTFEGQGQVSFVRVPFAMQHSFKYASVNATGREPLPNIAVANEALERRLDTLTSGARKQLTDSLRNARRAVSAARRDSARRGLLPDSVARVSPRMLAQRQQCDTSGYMVQQSTAARDPEHKHESLRVAYRVPCDMSVLATAPELPHSIFDDNDEIFGSQELDALIEQSLGMMAQPRWAPRRPVLHWGLELTRYNRVEGLSSGISAEQQLGAGYVWRAIGRLGTADVWPNAELTVARTNLARALSVTGYRRLVPVNDWGNPLSFGSSLSALLFGRDEGFYYRAGGIELSGTPEANVGAGRLTWRLFAERQRSALVSTTFSLGAPWLPNVETRQATYLGGALRLDRSYGLDPRGLRLLAGVRLEAAQPTESAAMLPNRGRYARASGEVTMSHGLGHDVLGALTLSGGSSAGDLPPQRRWLLGGAHTIRGQRPDTAVSGNAYWMTQGEVARDFGGMRGILFGDVGWTGDRRAFHDRAFGRPLSSVGAGTSFLDGLIRLDVARGIYPREQWRAIAYVEARM